MKLGLENLKIEDEDAAVRHVTFITNRAIIDTLFLQDTEHHLAERAQTTAVLCSDQ